jgi:hypothetical protein
MNRFNCPTCNSRNYTFTGETEKTCKLCGTKWDDFGNVVYSHPVSRSEAYEDLIRDEESQDNQSQVQSQFQSQTQPAMSQQLTRDELIAQAESILNVLKEQPVTKVNVGISLNQELALQLFNLGYNAALERVKRACVNYSFEVDIDIYAENLQISGTYDAQLEWSNFEYRIENLTLASREEELWDLLVDKFGEEQLSVSGYLPKPAR